MILNSNSRAALVFMVAAATALSACGDDGESSTAAPTVVASTTQVADLAESVAGERAEVIGLLAPNSDPHDYEPRPSDAEALIHSVLVVKSGGDVDLWVDDLVESSGTDAEVVSLIDSVQTIPGEEGADPHWWQSPPNAGVAVESIRDSLIEADPDGRAEYERNAREYLAQIDELDREIAACFDQVPPAQRKLVTSHDALGYFADHYGIEVVGSTIPALTTQAQASAGATAELVDLIQAEGVRAVFPEVGVSGSLEQAIAAETGAEVGTQLYADSLGAADSPGGTYLGAMAENADSMVRGFSGGERTCELST